MHVIDPVTHGRVVLGPGDEPGEDLAALITNPAAWEGERAAIVDPGDEQEPLHVQPGPEPEPEKAPRARKASVKPEPEEAPSA